MGLCKRAFEGFSASPTSILIVSAVNDPKKRQFLKRNAICEIRITASFF